MSSGLAEVEVINEKTGNVSVKRGTITTVKNKGTFDFSESASVHLGNFESQGGDIVIFSSSNSKGESGRVQADKVQFHSNTKVTITLRDFVAHEKNTLYDGNTHGYILWGKNSIDCRNASLKFVTENKEKISKGSKYLLFISPKIENFKQPSSFHDSLKKEQFKIEEKTIEKLKTLVLEVLQDIPAQVSPTSAVLSHNHIRGGAFKKHKEHGKSKKDVRFSSGTKASFQGDDFNVTNFNTQGTVFELALGNVKFSTDFAKHDTFFDGQFSLGATTHFGLFDLAHSATFISKQNLNSKTDSVSLQDSSFMSQISKTFNVANVDVTPNFGAGYGHTFGIDATLQKSGETFSVNNASYGSFIGELGLNVGSTFKLFDAEISAFGGANFVLKSNSPKFEMKNEFGDTILAKTSNQNIELCFGISAKVDHNTSFYTSFKSESYNNARSLEVGVKFQ